MRYVDARQQVEAGVPLADRRRGAWPTGGRPSDCLCMSRGPTHRVKRLIAQDEVSSELLVAADREADLLAHPYIGVEHLELARLGIAGQKAARERLRAQLTPGVPKRWWRPRGPGSALRRRGLAATRDAQRAAHRDEDDYCQEGW